MFPEKIRIDQEIRSNTSVAVMKKLFPWNKANLRTSGGFSIHSSNLSSTSLFTTNFTNSGLVNQYSMNNA